MKHTNYEVVCFGEILWDFLPAGPRPGGAPMNVAYHIQKLGVPVALISRVGDDQLGEDLLKILSDNFLTTEFVQKDLQQPTGIVNASIGLHNEVHYDIVHPVAWDFILQEKRLRELVTQATFFIYGSLVARDSSSRETLLELIDCANTKIVDINLRPPHYQIKFIEQLLASADILKLNEHELPLISSWYHNLKDDNDQVRWIQDKFSIPVIVVTKGGHGAMVLSNGNITMHKGYRVQVADTVGSGDAFLAGFIYMHMMKSKEIECLEFANAMGAFIASKNGACPNYEVDQVHQLLQTQKLVQ